MAFVILYNMTFSLFWKTKSFFIKNSFFSYFCIIWVLGLGLGLRLWVGLFISSFVFPLSCFFLFTFIYILCHSPFISSLSLSLSICLSFSPLSLASFFLPLVLSFFIPPSIFFRSRSLFVSLSLSLFLLSSRRPRPRRPRP